MMNIFERAKVARDARRLRQLRHTLSVGDRVEYIDETKRPPSHDQNVCYRSIVINVRAYAHGATEFLTMADDVWRPVTLIVGGWE